MLLADISAEGYAIIIGAIFLGLGKLVSMYLEHEREKAKILRDAAAAAKVEEVRRAAVTTAEKVEEVRQETARTAQEVQQSESKVQAQLENVVAKVEEVHKATNSLTDRLVETTKQEALARGGIEERERAEKRRQGGTAT